MRATHILRTSLLVAGLLAGMATPAAGATLTFTGGLSSDWNIAGNWTDAGDAAVHAVPNASDDVVIPFGRAPTLTGGQPGAVRSIRLDP